MLGINASFDQLSPAQLSSIAVIGAGFTGLLALSNLLGSIIWSPVSDLIGRQDTYLVIFLVGLTVYAAVPWTAAARSQLFVGFLCVAVSRQCRPCRSVR